MKSLVVFCLISFFTFNLSAATRTWNGGGGDEDWFNGANWGGVAPGAGDNVSIGAAYLVTLSNSTPALGNVTLAGRLMFTNWNTTLEAANVTVQNTGVITHAGPVFDGGMSNNIYIVCADLIVQAGGHINANSNGYSRGATSSLGHGPGSKNPGGYYPAAAHGGAASNNRFVYGSVTNPIFPGSGGYSHGTVTKPGGHGGGAVRINASGQVTVNGSITANGQRSHGYASTSGSGGSIYITCHTISGSGGVVSADGGLDLGNNGAGGGRIAVHYNSAAQAGLPVPDITFSARGGMDFRLAAKQTSDVFLYRYGDIGSLFFTDTRMLSSDLKHTGQLVVPGFNEWSVNNLVVSGWIRFPSDGFKLDVIGDLTVAGTNARLEIGGQALTFVEGQRDFRFRYNDAGTNKIICAGNLILTNSGDLVVYSGPAETGTTNYGALVDVAGDIVVATSNSWIYPVSHPTNGGSVLFRATNFRIHESYSGINADERGYSGGWTNTTQGNGPGSSGNLASSYGGCGGGRSNFTYGVASAPLWPGSGGYTFTPNHIGRSGGGLVRIEAASDILVNGMITANCGLNRGYASRPGSGGGIYITCQRLFGTNGVFSADGGGCIYENIPGGGGGRIAALYDAVAQSNVASQNITFSVKGGIITKGSFQHRWGDIGTLYFPDKAFLTKTIPHSGKFIIPGFTNWTLNNLTVLTNAWVGLRQEGFSLTVSNNLTITGPGARLEIGGNEYRYFLERRYIYSEPNGPDLICGGSLVVSNGGHLVVYAGLDRGAMTGAVVRVIGDMSIKGSNSWVEPASHPTNGASVRFYANNVTVTSDNPTNCGFRADERGYAGGWQVSGFGPGGGTGGGSYGGWGGNSALGPYGSSNEPVYSGSGGSATDQGKAGGGLVWIRAERDVQIDGHISANGGVRNGWNAGGGAGGGIYIKCKRFEGTTNSIFRVNGGLGQAGSGAGGRIAVWRIFDASPDVLVSCYANGGTGGLGPDGTDGTVVWGFWAPPEGSVITFW